MIAKIAPIKPVARVMPTILFEKAQAIKICTAVEPFYLDFHSTLGNLICIVRSNNLNTILK